MAMSDQEINELIDRIQSELAEPSAEMRNALHACRPGHPLGRDRERAEVFRSAAFMITGRRGSGSHADTLIRIAATIDAAVVS